MIRSHRARVPAGNPAGGQFSSRRNDEAELTLPQPWVSGRGRAHPWGGYDEIVDTGADTRWLRMGQHHNLTGPAHTSRDGFEAWYRNGVLHRSYGEPAVTVPGREQQWWANGLLHREEGPAIERASGRHEWWINGNEIPAPQPVLVDA